MEDKDRVFVTFNEVEYKVARFAGRCRRQVSRKNGLNDTKTYRKGASGYFSDVVGAIAEYAAAKYLDVYFKPYGSFKEADMAGIIQVRAITKKSNGEWKKLKVKPDPDRDQLVLGVRVAHEKDKGPYEIVGWTKVAWMKPQWYRDWDKNPYYDVPERELHKLDELQDILFKYRQDNHIESEKM